MEFGHICLVAAFLTSLYGLVAGAVAATRDLPRLAQSARNSIYVTLLFGAVALGALSYGFLIHDYRYAYVWRTSNNDMPAMYLISAVWGGMDGSMLLWAVLLSVYAACAVFALRKFRSPLLSWVVTVLHGSALFFYLVVTFLTNPFRFIDSPMIPLDGNGLNPLLQNPSMMIHPPMLYLGFTGFVVPFAFALATLLSGEATLRWTVFTRRWTLIAWGFLTIGIILGGNWAYIELGWGGFWAWDPVENASFLPWLTATAYLHSIMVEERRGMLKMWNLILPLLTYVLVVFGTFLTRSGVVQSVHAFASSDVGEVFLAYIFLVILGSAVLLWKRRRLFRPEHQFESLLSREALFLFNNLLFLAICFATFWGVMFPVFSEAFTGTQSVVGPPFFNAVNVPLFLILMFLMAVGPLVAWRKMVLGNLLRISAVPFAVAVVCGLVAMIAAPGRPLASLSFGLAFAAITAVFAEFHRGKRARKELGVASSYATLLRNKPRKYGGLLVHVGIAVMAIAITASMAFKIEQDIMLAKGESYDLGRFKLTLLGLSESTQPNYSVLHADVEVHDRFSGEYVGKLAPERRFYSRNEETTTEVDIRMSWREDLYIALAGLDVGSVENPAVDLAKTKAVFKVFVNPLQIWLWFGSLVVLVGTGIVLQSGKSLRSQNAVELGFVAESVN